MWTDWNLCALLVGMNVQWCSHCGKIWWILRKLNIEFPYDPMIPLPVIYPQDLKIGNQIDTCTPMLTAA